MTPEEAIGTLVRAVEQAQRRGAYSLQEAAHLHSAIQVFIKPETPPKAVTNDAGDDDSEV